MTITDRYWIRFNDEEYEDIRFKRDDYCNLALKGVDLLELLSLQKSEALRSAGNLLIVTATPFCHKSDMLNCQCLI